MKWRYRDHERPQGCCYDCKKEYKSWPDMSISNNMWELINPTYHEGAGLLCPTCMLKRLKHIGIKNVNAIFHL